MGVGETVDRVDRWQQSHRVPAFGFAVIKKFGQDQASNLAALIAYYAFFSIFPLLLALVTILGYVTAGNTHLSNEIFCSGLKQFPIIGSQCAKTGNSAGFKPLTGNAPALIVGIVLAVYSGLSVAKTAQNAFNQIYDVPRNARPNFIKSILRALSLIAIVGIGLIAATVVGSATSSAGSIGLSFIGPGLRVLALFASYAVTVAVFMVSFRRLTVAETTWRSVLPGAAIAGFGWVALTQLATAFVTHKLNSADSTYGTFGSVIVLLSWFYLAAQIVLFAAEINVVRDGRLWPRPLRTPSGNPAETAESALLTEQAIAEEPATGKR